MFRLVLVSLGLVAAALSQADAQDKSPCKLAEVLSLPMTPISGNRFTVPMTIDGKTYNALLDTGDDISLISYGAAQDLGLRVERSPPRSVGDSYVTPNGITISDFTAAHSVQLGNLKSDGRILMGLLPASSSEYDAALELAFLRGYDIDLDFGNRKFNLFSKDHCPGAVVYWTKGPVAVIPAKMVRIGASPYMLFPVLRDGKAIDAGLDTTAEHGVLDWDRAKFMFGFNEKSPQIQIVPGLSRDAPNYKFRSRRFLSAASR